MTRCPGISRERHARAGTGADSRRPPRGQGAQGRGHRHDLHPGGYGEAVRDSPDIGPALLRARESGKPSLINVWVGPEVHAPGTMNQTMHN